MANRKTHGFGQLVAEGHITDHTAITMIAHNHGANSTVQTIWGGGGYYKWPVAAEPLTIFSANVADGNGNIGANEITVVGLDANYEPITETVTLNGTANVITANSFLRVNRAYVSSVGSFQTNTGNISGVHGNTIGGPGSTVTSGVVLHIRAEDNASETGVYTVPANATAYIYSFTASSAKQGETEVNLTTRVNGNPYQVRSRLEVNSSKSDFTYIFPLQVVEKSDVNIICEASSPNTSVETIVEVLLINN